MKRSKPLILFASLFILFHLILLLMHHEKQVFWHIYTGFMLLLSLSYIYYERNINSKRLLESIITGVLAAIIILIAHALLSVILPDIRYFHILKVMVSLGIYFKWQLIISFVVSFLFELYIRSILQNELMQRLNVGLTIFIVAIISTSFFSWAVSLQILSFIFIVECIVAASYQNTKRLITPLIGKLLAMLILMLMYGQ